MKKNIWIPAIFIIAVIAMGLLFALPAKRQSALRERQEQLAKSLEVNIQDYPDQADFPVGYFYSVLKPKMTLDEVHRIVRGYESVYNCYGLDEVYYFYSKDPNQALRFALHYDKQGYFIDLEGEDPDSRTLGLGPGCSDGLLEK